MKNKILIIFALLLFVGCGKTTDSKEEPQSKELTSELNYIVKDQINDEIVRIYAVLKNNSENDGRIKSLKLMLVDTETNELAYSEEKEYNYSFNAGE